MNRYRQEPKLGLRTCSLSRAGSFDTQTLGRLKEAGFDLVETLPETARGAGGFGSTGVS